jgi:hypothetical protein
MGISAALRASVPMIKLENDWTLLLFLLFLITTAAAVVYLSYQESQRKKSLRSAHGRGAQRKREFSLENLTEQLKERFEDLTVANLLSFLSRVLSFVADSSHSIKQSLSRLIVQLSTSLRQRDNPIIELSHSFKPSSSSSSSPAISVPTAPIRTHFGGDGQQQQLQKKKNNKDGKAIVSEEQSNSSSSSSWQQIDGNTGLSSVTPTNVSLPTVGPKVIIKQEKQQTKKPTLPNPASEIAMEKKQISSEKESLSTSQQPITDSSSSDSEESQELKTQFTEKAVVNDTKSSVVVPAIVSQDSFFDEREVAAFLSAEGEWQEAKKKTHVKKTPAPVPVSGVSVAAAVPVPGPATVTTTTTTGPTTNMTTYIVSNTSSEKTENKEQSHHVQTTGTKEKKNFTNKPMSVSFASSATGSNHSQQPSYPDPVVHHLIHSKPPIVVGPPPSLLHHSAPLPVPLSSAAVPPSSKTVSVPQRGNDRFDRPPPMIHENVLLHQNPATHLNNNKTHRNSSSSLSSMNRISPPMSKKNNNEETHKETHKEKERGEKTASSRQTKEDHERNNSTVPVPVPVPGTAPGQAAHHQMGGGVTLTDPGLPAMPALITGVPMMSSTGSSPPTTHYRQSSVAAVQGIPAVSNMGDYYNNYRGGSQQQSSNSLVNAPPGLNPITNSSSMNISAPFGQGYSSSSASLSYFNPSYLSSPPPSSSSSSSYYNQYQYPLQPTHSSQSYGNFIGTRGNNHNHNSSSLFSPSFSEGDYYDGDSLLRGMLDDILRPASPASAASSSSAVVHHHQAEPQFYSKEKDDHHPHHSNPAHHHHLSHQMIEHNNNNGLSQADLVSDLSPNAPVFQPVFVSRDRRGDSSSSSSLPAMNSSSLLFAEESWNGFPVTSHSQTQKK